MVMRLGGLEFITTAPIQPGNGLTAGELVISYNTSPHSIWRDVRMETPARDPQGKIILGAEAALYGRRR